MHEQPKDPPPALDGTMLFELIMANDRNLVFVKDEESRLLYANRAFREIYAPEDRDSLIGRTTVESFTPDEADFFLSEDRRAFREGHSEIVEEIKDWKGANRVLLSRKIAVDLPHGGRGLIGISTDITTLAARERRLVRLNAQLKIYSHSIAHDLKNPIVSILAGLNVIQRDKSSTLSERSLMVADAIRDSANGLSGSISSMLRAADSEAKGLEYRAYDLNILLEEVRFNLSAAMEEANLDLHVTRLPSAVVEPNLMRQLFQNLIENTIKHSGVDHPVVTVHYNGTDEEHIFYVGDNGQGIPEEKRNSVFTQFFKGGTNDEGLGLGLTLCQRIANLHDGYIEVHDRVERGCCMVIRIPIKR